MTPQDWAADEISAIQNQSDGSGRLAFILPSLKNEWAMKQMNDASFVALLSHPELPVLESLFFSNVDITASTVSAIVDSPKSRSLTALSFAFEPLGDAGLKAMAGWQGLKSLTTLSYDKCGVTADGLSALLTGPYGQELPGLSLKWQAIGDSGAAVLAQARLRGNLTLTDTQIGGAGARRLIESAPSRALYLNENPIGPGGLVGLVGIGEGLVSLNLQDCGLDETDAKALAAVGASPDFKGLYLRDDLGDAGVLAIAKAPWLGQLEQLLVMTKASAAAKTSLSAAWGERAGLNIDGHWTQAKPSSD